jgi:hypothetical protein
MYSNKEIFINNPLENREHVPVRQMFLEEIA